MTQFIDRKGSGSIDALSPVRVAMGLCSAGSLFDENKLNVVVEGITDNYYLTAFRELLNKNKNLHFVPVCGVQNVKNLVGVLIGWGMKYKAVFDDDADQGRAAYNDLKKYYFENNGDLAREHILKIKGCIGIEDIFSKPDFKKYVLTRDLNDEEKKMKNSDFAKVNHKELLAREFLEKVRANPEDVQLSETSLKKINEVFDWLYEKFDLKE